MVSMRTNQLVGTVIRDSCGVLEANHSAVAVQEQPNHVPRVTNDGNPRWQSFQKHYEDGIAADTGMVKHGQGMTAVAGSLSHGHFNCGCRNIMSGMHGCECQEGPRGDGKCDCLASPILDAAGKYSLSQLEKYDTAWFDLCSHGIKWEMLSWVMDVEEPDAASVISIALDKNNEAVMKTSGLEIWNTLVGLCKPDPLTGAIPYEPIRDKLIDLYGSAADNPNLLSMFRLVLDAGGSKSPHLHDLYNFIVVHVNPKLRKLKDDAYGVVTVYPLTFVKIKIASLKWAWRQKPNKGWCEAPPSILHRFKNSSST